MELKAVDREYIKSGLVLAAVDLLKVHGLQGLKISMIEQKAGYSTATFYEHFNHTNEILPFCVRQIELECSQSVSGQIHRASKGVNKIKAIVKAYIHYLLQYPNLFNALFWEKSTPFDHQLETSVWAISFLDRLCADEWEFCINKKQFTGRQILRLRQEIRYVAIGMLSLYINRNHPQTRREFDRAVKEQLERILAKDR